MLQSRSQSCYTSSPPHLVQHFLSHPKTARNSSKSISIMDDTYSGQHILCWTTSIIMNNILYVYCVIWCHMMYVILTRHMLSWCILRYMLLTRHMASYDVYVYWHRHMTSYAYYVICYLVLILEHVICMYTALYWHEPLRVAIRSLRHKRPVVILGYTGLSHKIISYDQNILYIVSALYRENCQKTKKKTK